MAQGSTRIRRGNAGVERDGRSPCGHAHSTAVAGKDSAGPFVGSSRGVFFSAGKPPAALVLPDAAAESGGGGSCCFGRVFRYIDSDGDGKISPSELRSCMSTVGEDLSEEDAEAVVESTDSDGDGLLGFDDFAKLVAVGGEEERTRGLRGAFTMYAAAAAEEEAFITPTSLRRMLCRLGEWKSLEECRLMIRRFDVDGDGVLSFDEFRIMMML